MPMKRLIGLLIVAFVLAGLDPAAAGPEEIGDAHRVALVDTQNSKDVDVPDPPDTGGTSTQAGKNRSGGRGPGDRPPKPSLIYMPGVGGCAINGGVYWMTDPHAVADKYPPCPPASGPSSGARPAAPPPPTPLEAAYQVWYWETTLPSPTLAASPPNGAVTGLDFYLTIGGPQSLVFDVPALGYSVHLEVTSVYDVDWGDPRPDDSRLGQAITKGHRTQGGPYPKGDLRHRYIQRGNATIDVTQRWTATWSAGGESGTIADRLATSGTMTVPVQEIQAVLRP